MTNKLVKIASLVVVIAFCLAFIGNDSIQKSAGGPPYNTNAPGEKTCSGSEGTNSCHSGGIADNSGPGTPDILFSGGTIYVPGQTYTVAPQISHPTRNRFGFQIVSLKDSNNAFVGAITLIDTNQTRQQQPTWGSFQDRWFVMHQLQGSYPTTPNLGKWTYKWTAPSYNAGNISFYACYLAANNSNTSDPGDETYWKKITLTPSAVGIAQNKTIRFVMYPNPVSNLLHVSIPAANEKNLSIALLNLEGKIIKSLASVSSKEIIDIQEVENGIYFVLIRDAGGQLLNAERIIIQH